MSLATTASPALLPDLPDFTPARRTLYEAAIVLFGELGFHGVSVRDLMASLGQQPGALYNHVASKQDLLYDLMCIGQNEHRSRLRAALLDAGSDPADQLFALTAAHVRAHLDYPALGRVTNREIRALTDPQRAALEASRDETHAMFADVVQRGLRMGVFTNPDPHLAIMAIGSMGIRTAEWWSEESTVSASHVADTYAAFAVRLLVP